MRRFALLLLLIGCGCSQNNHSDRLETMECSYRFVATDGREKSRTKQIAVGEPDTNDTIRTFFDDLQHDTGSATFQIVLPNISVTEIQATLVNGREEGTVRTFTEIGGKRRLTLEQPYRHGAKHGKSTAHFASGEVQYSGDWKQGSKEGIWTFSYPNGKPALIANYMGDALSGACTVFNKSGASICSGNYHAGKPTDGTFLSDVFEITNAMLTRIPELETSVAKYSGGIKVGDAKATISIDLPQLR